MTVTGTSVDLSPREIEVLDAVAEHLTNAEIAARLFISVRTVESHVAALLRKTGSASRRELAVRAARSGRPGLPRAALTPFIGRAAERSALSAALRSHRLVTALGPGGVGKTRLALAIAADLQGERGDGVRYVDLVPVPEASRVPNAVATALGVPEQPGRPLVDTIGAWLAGQDVLLVLDNCEHVVEGVAPLLEGMLTGGPGLTVLATSRVRLGLPVEWVFPVPGLSVQEDEGDAVELFRARALAVGADPAALVPARIASICRSLDGLALAIELAAARVPALGLDGLEAGLGQRLELLRGDRRADGRHRSLRAALDWSVALLGPAERAVLRRVSVFAAPFSAAAAAALLTDWPPVHPGAVPGLLADLTDASLLVAASGPGSTRLRALETIRQYGAEQLEAAGEAAEAQGRHLDWCLAALDGLGDAPSGQWRGAFDPLADEARAAVGRVWELPDRRSTASLVARRFGDLAFARGRAGEAQRAYERAAALTDAHADAAELLDRAAGAAEWRHFGDDALALHRRSADAAIRAGRRGAAAWQLARSVEFSFRNRGVVGHPPPRGSTVALVDEARRLVDDDPAAQIRLAIAELYLGEGIGAGEGEALLHDLTTRAHLAGDHFGESAALDGLAAVQLTRNDVPAALTALRRRLEVLEQVPVTAAGGGEFTDAVSMALECELAVGDLAAAALMADRWSAVPAHAEEPHLGLSRPILVAVLSGDLLRAATMAHRFADGWERAGRPLASNLAACAAAGGAACDLLGDPDGAARLRGVAAALLRGRTGDRLRGAVFDALPMLHRGDAGAAVERLLVDPEADPSWFNGIWRAWYAATWAEAGVLAGVDGRERVDRARPLVAHNPIAAALVERAAVLMAGSDGLAAIADRLDSAGARYQAARTRAFSGDVLADRGASELAALGAVPMGTAGMPAVR